MTLKPADLVGRARIEIVDPNPSVSEGLELLAAFFKIKSPEKRAEAIAYVNSLSRPQ